jgi:hypothetical protein
MMKYMVNFSRKMYLDDEEVDYLIYLEKSIVESKDLQAASEADTGDAVVEIL